MIASRITARSLMKMMMMMMINFQKLDEDE